MNDEAALFIAGQDERNGDSTFDVVNPYSGKLVSTWPSASEAQCDAAVDALAAFQPTWEATPPSQKRMIFLKAADLITSQRYSDRIKAKLVSETDASPAWQHLNVVASAAFLREAASQCSNIKGEYHRSEKPDVDMYIVQRRAVGVVFGIAPWNAPINLSLRAIALPLVCGNTVILKASEYSPGSQRIVVDCLLEAGLPPQAIAYLCFSRKAAPSLTARIIARREIGRVNFTGSDVVGRLIAAECGKNLKQCILELGGKAPFIVSKHSEENLESAAWGCVFGALMHSGQVCMSTERVLVQRDVYERFEKLVHDRVSKIRSGDVKAGAQLGALFTQNSANTVISHIKDAVSKGAKKVVVGDTLEAEGEHKTLVQPTVLGNVTQEMSIWSRESFGPVIALKPFDTMEEAIQLANKSEYSLIASLWTDNLHEAMTYAPKLKAGSVQVNGSTIHIEPSFGNAGLGGASGYGRFTIDAFTDLRSIAFHAPNGKFPVFGP